MILADAFLMTTTSKLAQSSKMLATQTNLYHAGDFPLSSIVIHAS
jgi:hypothetical protein